MVAGLRGATRRPPGGLPLIPIVSLWTASIVAGPAHAQDSVRVTVQVVDEVTERPITGAEIRYDGDRAAFFSDGSGYVLFAPSRRDLHLSVSSLGYRRLDTVLVVREEPISTTLSLEPVPLSLLPLSVTTLRWTEGRIARVRLNQEPLPFLFTFEQEELRTIPHFAEPDVLTVAQTHPSVLALNDYSAQLHVYGGGPDQNLFLLDGVPILAPYHLFGFAGAFLPEAVDEVQITPLSIPARRGGRLSSVVEVRQAPPATDTTRIAGGIGILGSRITVEGRRGSLGWVLGARRAHLDLVDADLPYRFWDSQGRIDLDLGAENRVSVTAYGSRDRFEWPFDDLGEGLQSGWSNAAVGLKWAWTGNGWATRAQTWVSAYSGSLNVGDGRTSRATENDVSTRGARFELLVPRERDGLRGGVEVVRDHARLSGSQGGYLEDRTEESQTRASAFLEVERWLGPVRLAPGVRATFVPESDEWLLEPRVFARYHFRPDWFATVGLVRAHQFLRALRDDRYLVPGAPMWMLPDGGDASTSTAGLLEMHGWLSPDVGLNVGTYYRRFEGIPSWRPTGSRTLDRLERHSGSALGGHVLLRRHTGNLTGWLGYGYGSVRIQSDSASYRPTWDRRHSVDLALQWADPDRYAVTFRLQYGSGTPFWLPAGEVDGYRLDPERRRISRFGSFPVWTDSQDRFEPYFRADLGARYCICGRRWRIEPYVNLLNATNHSNVLFYRVGIGREDRPLLVPEPQLPIIPTIGLDITF